MVLLLLLLRGEVVVVVEEEEEEPTLMGDGDDEDNEDILPARSATGKFEAKESLGEGESCNSRKPSSSSS